MQIAEVIYKGELRNEAKHLRSGQVIITDAPLDNQGKGEAFSPTDLMSASLGTCMLTIMGIAARTHEFSIEGTRLKVSKIMASNPRRISEIHIEFEMPKKEFTEKQKVLLDHAARTCPVALSIHPDLKQVVTFSY